MLNMYEVVFSVCVFDLCFRFVLSGFLVVKHEHFVPVANIFGPANTGKTLACAIALQIMQSPELMLSRCTASSMIDTTNMMKNMLIVWDDPRDCTASQLSAIVHEAFNGLANCTISRGTRHYNF